MFQDNKINLTIKTIGLSSQWPSNVNQIAQILATAYAQRSNSEVYGL